MTIKIAFFLPSLRGGGAERIFASLANSLVNQGYLVDFVLSSADGVFLSKLDSKIKYFDLGHKHVINSFFNLIRYLKAQRPNVLLSGLSNANAAAITAGRIFLPSCKVIITQHLNWPQVLANNPTLKERLVYQLSKYLYPLAARIVAVSNEIAVDIRLMKNVDPEKVLCIYNPVITPELLELSRLPAVHPWLAGKNEPVLLGVGRLFEQKDFATLIRAFFKVRSQIACKLLILGDGPERKILENLVQRLDLSGQVELPGFSSNPYAAMTNADLFVLSSKYEGLPTVLIEALACGTSVVATDCVSGPAEILDGGKYGRLVPVGDEEALAKAIIDSLQNPANKRWLEEKAQLFTIDNATRMYASLIERVIAAN